MRFRQRAPKRSYLTKRESEVLLSPIATQATGGTESRDGTGVTPEDSKAAGELAMGRTLAARDHAAFSAMIYAGFRIEESTALTIEDPP